MERKYAHLSAEERATIMIETDRGASLRSIARLLNRSPSTISREVARGCSPAGRYRATQAGRRYRERRRASVRRCKIVEGNWLWQWVRDGLCYRYWSPHQIAARLREMHPEDSDRQVSAETIYRAIYAYPRGSLKAEMVASLRQAKPARGRRRTTAASAPGFVPEQLRIVHRPEAIEHRQLPGHWEGDFIKGTFNRSAVGTLVERKTRFVVLCRMDGCTAQDALEGFTRQLGKMPAFLRQSLTYDRGSEMACHRELAQRLKLNIWFADPHAPWQRGSNENTNGLLRQFLPKGTDLSALSQTALNDIARLLNGRPRQTLGWKTPEEVLSDVMAQHAQSVALDL